MVRLPRRTKPADHPGDPSAQLRTWLKDMAAQVASGDERGCPLANAAVELPEKDHPARRVIEAFKTAQRERLVQLCAAAALAEPEMLADELFLLLGGVSRPWTEDGVRAHHLAAQRGGNLARRSHCPSTILSRTAPMTPEAEPSLLRETAIIAALSAVMGLLLMSRRLFIVIRRGTSFAARPVIEDGKEPGDIFGNLTSFLARDLTTQAWLPDSASRRKIAVSLRRSCPMATRRRSMFGVPNSSLPRPIAAARARSCGDRARPEAGGLAVAGALHLSLEVSKLQRVHPPVHRNPLVSKC
jgi:hypothetical protein